MFFEIGLSFHIIKSPYRIQSGNSAIHLFCADVFQCSLRNIKDKSLGALLEFFFSSLRELLAQNNNNKNENLKRL